MSFVRRPKPDQPIITSLIRGARLNPRNLQWPRFLVAEGNGRVVGLRQVKMHKGGTREVASGFVVPEYRHREISARLMREILARERGTLYLMCNENWAHYYEQFGFRRVAPDGLPPDFGKEYRIGRIVTTLLSLFTPHKVRIIPMKREGVISSTALTAKTDPVLAQLWDNPKDATYDRV